MEVSLSWQQEVSGVSFRVRRGGDGIYSTYDVKGLSGGQRALLGFAFLLSLTAMKPQSTPLYLIDEVCSELGRDKNSYQHLLRAG